ncbi:MAG: bifunctional phosphoribosylaminoimidazolecarboxamide formyltransferase/IMP cyclohydrolase [Omnitrophica WOR_2 bacterium RIFCSPHIGHO2_01_FULL_48_9]|nr:MAG: bifunctional phosphoribosylaminoimidazolecarboxamide formyltransferase/IMP cyclohydrolase [Omnitrophica WOR_2 bacterium RIFCSPHIGHO2_02_FULL_48_11]OGX29915.1 MAG: bifunctional phosphoribosylaminoimidazolecarboxamide formyltransferase/IMP cyclohydrolase [Omnitrophica WOR_2 bacterium RIFCSPHIGHO2_01_FULL_48_9]
MIKIKKALISVSDKTGLLEFARALQARGIAILSTGGTARFLKSNNILVREVSDYTGFPEILDGRVKTLHPFIHAGLLALRDKAEHMKELERLKIETIDMVVINLYPFEKVAKKKNVSLEEAIENIDVGGPTMIRAAAKNYKSVAVVSNPEKYKDILKELEVNSGILSDAVLFKLSVEAFAHTAQYDSVIYHFLNHCLSGEDFSKFPKDMALRFVKVQDLRYGENPHQAAAFYKDPEAAAGLFDMKQLHGKELSFNNLLDLNAAVDFVKDFARPAAVVIKHNNPTGIAEDEALATAYTQAWKCDPLSAFGGIIGFNRTVNSATAKAITKSGFMECIIAPGYDKGAFQILSQKKNIRLMQLDLGNLAGETQDFKKVFGGLLLQDKDTKPVNRAEWKMVTKIQPTKAQMDSLEFGWKAIRNIKSNAVILVKGCKTVGIGCGQTSRVDSAAAAIRKAGKNAKGAFLVSDAFLPKIDTVTVAAKAGIKAIIQTGGSIEDANVIKAADKAKVAMIMTGTRHFKH